MQLWCVVVLLSHHGLEGALQVQALSDHVVAMDKSTAIDVILSRYKDRYPKWIVSSVIADTVNIDLMREVMNYRAVRGL